MERNTAILAIAIALVAGLAVGFAVGKRQAAGPSESAGSLPQSAQNVVDVFRNAGQRDDTARQACLKEKLGAERYAALVLNPNAVTTEDQFKVLACSGGS